jgi:hypothetical protein
MLKLTKNSLDYSLCENFHITINVRVNIRRLDGAEKLTQGHPTVPEEAWLLVAQAKLAVTEKRWSETCEVFEKLTNLVTASGVRWYLAQILYEWAVAYIESGQPQHKGNARDLLIQAKDIFEQLGNQCYLCIIKKRLKILAEQLKSIPETNPHVSPCQHDITIQGNGFHAPGGQFKGYIFYIRWVKGNHNSPLPLFQSAHGCCAKAQGNQAIKTCG